MHGHRPAGSSCEHPCEPKSLLLSAAVTYPMASKKSPKRRMGKYLKGKIDQVLELGTLAANTLVSGTVAGSVAERTRVSSIVATWGIADWTLAVGDGPVLVGVAHSDYTDAEIEAWVENSGSWTEGDKIQQEIANRKIRQIGLLTAPQDGNIGSQVTLNDGKPIKTKLNWILTTSQTLKIWAYNAGDSAFATTVPHVFVNGHANLFPT